MLLTWYWIENGERIKRERFNQYFSSTSFPFFQICSVSIVIGNKIDNVWERCWNPNTDGQLGQEIGSRWDSRSETFMKRSLHGYFLLWITEQFDEFLWFNFFRFPKILHRLEVDQKVWEGEGDEHREKPSLSRDEICNDFQMENFWWGWRWWK